MTMEVLISKSSKKIKPKIVYGFDTLCGWCYGFSDELNKAIHILKDEVDFELVNAGLFAGIRGPKMGYMSGHIRRNMDNVTNRTGKEFGVNFLKLLDSANYPYNSMKASVAIEVIKDMLPEKIFDFASKIQGAFFGEGKDIQADEVYLSLLNEYDICKSQFIEKLNSKLYENKTQESFFKAQQYGFSGEGFVTANQFITLIKQEINK